jgi:hypothetical protein
LDIRGKEWWETGEDCIMRSFIALRFIDYYWGDQVEENEMGDM